jgi:hypothetical protein
MGAIDGSVWKTISSEEEASLYALSLMGRLEIEGFLESRHLIPCGDYLDEFEEKYAGALSYTGQLEHDEFPVYIYDNTYLGLYAKTGVMATNKALYFAHSIDSGTKKEWSEIEGFDGYVIKTKSGNTATLPAPAEEDKKSSHLKILRQMWQDLR